MIKVLIVEDSRTVSQYLEYILSNDPKIEVVGNVSNGQLAIDFVKKNKPDIITMDIDMPRMNGLEATRQIMAENPVPIIVVTATRNINDVHVSMEALAAGALTVIEKPVGIGHPSEEAKTKKMLSLVKIYSEVKVVARKYKSKSKLSAKTSDKQKGINKTLPVSKLLNRKYLLIGISSGGPPVLSEIFSKVSRKFPYPILVVQHITPGFLEGMVTWLNRLTKIPVCIASDGEMLLPGKVYFAPDNFQMGISLHNIKLYNREKNQRICPSVKFLFNNFAQNLGKDTIAMLLTGMGSDGSKELKKLQTEGALTIAQDEESSLVFGMPGEAVKLNAADYVLNPGQIADILLELEKNGS